MVTSNAVEEGDYIVWDVNGDKQTLVEVKGNGRCKLGNSWVSVRQILGKPWGCAVEIGERGQLVNKEVEVEWDDIEMTTKDNSKLVDANLQNQHLKHEDIERMKAEGVPGATIVAMLAESSATWEEKTEFAQKKWLKKKAKKHCPWALIRRPTAASICETLFTHQPQRIWEMRLDSLACMLSLANVGAYAKVLIVDDCNGLLTGAVSERMGPTGHVLCVTTHEGKGSPFETVRSFNLSDGHIQRLHSCTFTQLMTAVQRSKAVSGVVQPTAQQRSDDDNHVGPSNGVLPPVVDHLAASAAGAATTTADTLIGAAANMPLVLPSASQQGAASESLVEQQNAGLNGQKQAAVPPSATGNEPCHVPQANGCSHDAAQAAQGDGPGQEAHGSGNSTKGDTAAAAVADDKRLVKGRRRVPALTSVDKVCSLLQAGFDCLLVAVPSVDQSQVLRCLLPLLQPSSAFCGYSPWVQPLADALAALQGDKLAVNLLLQESWFRDYQVLPQRTHPHMMIPGSGGFLISGITVSKAPPGKGQMAKEARSKRQRR